MLCINQMPVGLPPCSMLTLPKACKDYCRFKLACKNQTANTHTHTHVHTESVWVQSQSFIWSHFQTSQHAIGLGVCLKRGEIDSREKQGTEKRGEMTPCSNDFQMHEPMPTPWCFSSPPPFLSAFARIRPLLSSTREAAYRPSCPSTGQRADRMKAGNR